MQASYSPQDLNNQAFSYFIQADFIKAEQLYKQILNIPQCELDHLKTARTMYDLGVCYKNLAQYPNAKEQMTNARAIFENKVGVDDPQLAITLRNLADIYEAQDNSEEANKLKNRALEIWQEYLIPLHSQTAINLKDFDSLYGRKSEDEQIELMLASAKQHTYELLLYSMPFAAAAMYELATLKKAFGNYKSSINLGLKALDQVSPSSLSTTMILQHLAQVNHLVGNYDQSIKYYEQTLAVLQKHNLNHHPSIPEIYYELGKSLLADGSYSRANESFLKAQTILENNLSQHPLYAYILNERASLSETKNDYAEAENLYKQAAEIIRATLGNKHRKLAEVWDNLARLYQKQKNYEEAETLWFRALDITQSNTETHSSAKVFDSLANLYREQNKYQKAELVYRKALVARKNALLSCKEEIARTHLNMAHFYLDWCKFIDAEKYFASALDLAQTSFGSKSLEAIECHEGLGIVYMKQGKFKEAEFILRQVLIDKKEKSDDTILISTWIALGDLNEKLERYDSAMDGYEQIIKIIRKTEDEQHSLKICAVLNMMAKVESHRNNISQAVSYYEQSLDMMESSSKLCCSTLIDSLIGLSGLYDRQQKTQKAEVLLEHARLIVDKRLDGNGKEMIIMLLSFAEHCQHKNSSCDPFYYYKKALTLSENTLGTHHPLVVGILCKIGEYYKNENLAAKAAETYMRALTVMESLYGSKHPDLASTLVDLARIYIDQGNLSNAKPLLKRSLSIFEESLGTKHTATLQTNELLSNIQRQ